MSKFGKYGIIGLVVISFLFFGIYGVVTSQKSYVAKIDGEKIPTVKFNQYLSERKQSILSQQVDKATLDFVASKQFENLMLNEMINSILIHKFLQDNGLNITQSVAASYIKTLQAFTKDGQFDSQYFQKYLQYTNKTEKEFLQKYIPQIEETLFAQITNGVKFSMENIAVDYVKYQKKERNFDILMLENNKPFEHKEDELTAYYETVKNQFVQASKHVVTISYLDDYINQNIKIFQSTPQNIAQYYNEEYMGRNIKVQYAVFKDKETAQTLQSIVKKQGIVFQNVLDTMLSKNPNNILKHSTETSNNIENSKILLAIRNLPKNGITPIIELQEGYYVAQILEIKEKTFAEIGEKQNIDKEILQKRKCNNIQIFTDRISQDLQSGISFEGASLKYGFPISKQVIIDAKTHEVLNANTNLPETINQNLLEHILQNKDTLYGHVFNTNKEKCSFIIYKQTKIEPERILSLSEVRGKILEMYSKHKKLLSLQTEAKVIESNIKSLKQDLSSYKQSGKFINANLGLNNNISQDLFTKPLNQTFAITGKDGNVYLITPKLEKPYTGTISDAEIKQAQQYVENVYYNTYLQEWLNAMYKKYSVKIYI